MADAGRADRVDRDLDTAVGAVLEADRHREPGAELAMDLALDGAGADRPPADGVGDVLRGDRIEELAADRQPECEHVEQQPPRHPQPSVDVGGAVEPRIVDQALPADRRARLLEVHAHRDAEVVAQPLGLGRQALGVLAAGVDVMDAAGSDDDQQPVVGAAENGTDLGSAADQDIGARVARAAVRAAATAATRAAPAARSACCGSGRSRDRHLEASSTQTAAGVEATGGRTGTGESVLPATAAAISTRSRYSANSPAGSC